LAHFTHVAEIGEKLQFVVPAILRLITYLLKHTLSPGVSTEMTSVEGDFEIGSQYHFHLETQSCLVRPLEEGQFDVVSSTQWMDKVQVVVAKALAVPTHKINMTVSCSCSVY
jgi:xanthine dehydrogenase molybdopterin-binding subunit B